MANARNVLAAPAADFAETNPWLGDGEERVETDTRKSKIGPGYWNDLDYGAGQTGASGASGAALIYGDGSDGDITIATTTETVWAPNTVYTIGDLVAPRVSNGHRFRCTTGGTSRNNNFGPAGGWNIAPGGTTTDNTVEWTEDGEHAVIAGRLARDVFAENLTIPAGLDLSGANNRLFVRDTLTIGTGSDLCSDGSTTGWAMGSGNLCSAGAGGDPVTDAATDGNPGDTGGACLDIFYGTAGKGGDAGSNAGGQTGQDAAPVSWRVPHAAVGGLFDPANIHGGTSTLSDGSVATSGGSGANDDAAASGAGGAGGGVLVVAARRIVNNGVIRAAGGDGSDATGPGNGGGGGGGQGGVVIIACDSYTGDAPTAPGGLAGAGVGSGDPGTAGDDGIVVVIRSAA